MSAAAEFQSLLDQRDLAAYRVVAAVAVLFFETDFNSALARLRIAHSEFQQADFQIDQFHKSHTGEPIRHGNHSSAA